MRRLPPTSRGVPARCRRGSLRDQQQHQSFTSGTLPRLSSHYVVRSYDGGNSWTRPQLVTTLNDNCFVIATPDEEAAMAQLVRRSMSSTTFREADREAQALGERPRVRPRSRCGHDLRSPALQEVDERHQDLHLLPHTCGGWDNTGRAATRRQPVSDVADGEGTDENATGMSGRSPTAAPGSGRPRRPVATGE